MTSENTKQQKPSFNRPESIAWDGQQIRALREFMGLTQRQMADELAVRQQTISEWETGQHVPHRSTQKTLTMVAERAGFSYQSNGDHDAGN
jgi:DNA-binding transcriptional regulator YiaG